MAETLPVVPSPPLGHSANENHEFLAPGQPPSPDLLVPQTYVEPQIQWLPESEPRAVKASISELTRDDKQIPEALLCPICMEFHTPLVLQCGHSLCDVCEAKLKGPKACPLCKAPYLQANKNYALIAIMDTIEIRCRYGCGAYFPASQEVQHISACTFTSPTIWRLLQKEIAVSQGLKGREMYLPQPLPLGEECIAFDVNCQGEFRVVINDSDVCSRGTAKEVVNIVFGKHVNSETVLETHNPPSSVPTSYTVASNSHSRALVSHGRWRTYYVSYCPKTCQVIVGVGNTVGSEAILMAIMPTAFTGSRLHLGFANWNDPVTFRNIRCTVRPRWYHAAIRVTRTPPSPAGNGKEGANGSQPDHLHVWPSDGISCLWRNKCGNQQKTAERQFKGFGWPGRTHYSYSTKLDTVLWIICAYKRVAQLKVLWPGSTIQAVLTGHERYKTYQLQPSAQDPSIYSIPMKADFLPRAPGNGAWPVLDIHTMLYTKPQHSKLSLRLEHNSVERAAGNYQKKPQWQVADLARLHFVFAAWHILEDLEHLLNIPQGGMIKVAGFDVNNPLNDDFPPHLDISYQLPSGQRLTPHFIFDWNSGGITQNSIKGQTYKPGQSFNLGNSGLTLIIHPSGGLQFATQAATYAIMRDKTVSRFSDGVVVHKNDIPAFRLLVTDNTSQGMMTVVLQFFTNATAPSRFSQFTTIRYDPNTGSLKEIIKL